MKIKFFLKLQSLVNFYHQIVLYAQMCLNGPQFNEVQFNGPQFNEPQFNGLQFNEP